MKEDRLMKVQYFLQEAIRSLLNNRGRAFVSIATIGFSLFIFGIFLLVSQNIKSHVENWQDEINIELFLADELTMKETERIREQLESRDDVTEVVYISKKDALNRFQNQGYDQFIEGLESNPLPASFQIQLVPEKRNIAQIEKISSELLTIPGIEDVTSGIDLVEKLNIVARFLKLSGIFAGILIFIASVFIISNTIKLSLYTRIDEIEIMKLVGGTNGFIMSPYLFEGILQGFAGGLSAIIFLFLSYEIFMIKLQIDEFVLLGLGSFSFISPLQWIQILGIGIIIGFLGSYISVSQFLKPHFSTRLNT